MEVRELVRSCSVPSEQREDLDLHGLEKDETKSDAKSDYENNSRCGQQVIKNWLTLIPECLD